MVQQTFFGVLLAFQSGVCPRQKENRLAGAVSFNFNTADEAGQLLQYKKTFLSEACAKAGMEGGGSCCSLSPFLCSRGKCL